MTKRKTRFNPRALACGLVLAAMHAGFAAAAEPAAKGEDPNWPCVTPKVSELSAAAIWDGPQITDTTSWNNDEDIRKLSAYVISRRVKVEDAEAAIKKFAAGLPADKHDAKLTELFSAVLARTNEGRKVVINGIERFSKRQHERADEIQKMELAMPPDKVAEAGEEEIQAGEVEGGKLSDAQEKYKWEVRAFQQKEANIPIACEIPELLDQRAGDIARAIRAEMKN